VDASGESVHNTAPALWKERIATGEFSGIPIASA
jgi:fumarate hydratase class I